MANSNKVRKSKVGQRLTKELLVYIGVLVVLSAVMHQDAWLAHPLEHIESLKQSSFGAFHPLFFALGGYLLLALVRLLFLLAKKLFTSRG